jgi:penicillin-binding protein 1A
VAILEAFKPGTAPPDYNAVIGATNPDGTPVAVSPEAESAARTGRGLW